MEWNNGGGRRRINKGVGVKPTPRPLESGPGLALRRHMSVPIRNKEVGNFTALFFWPLVKECSWEVLSVQAKWFHSPAGSSQMLVGTRHKGP